MAANKRLAGTVFVSANGVAYDIVSDPTWSISNVVRESLVGMNGYHGHSEKPSMTFMSAVIRDRADVPVATFRDMVNVPVVFELNSGKTVIGSNMVVTEAIEVNSTDATFKVRWEGPEVIEA